MINSKETLLIGLLGLMLAGLYGTDINAPDVTIENESFYANPSWNYNSPCGIERCLGIGYGNPDEFRIVSMNGGKTFTIVDGDLASQIHLAQHVDAKVRKIVKNDRICFINVSRTEWQILDVYI